MLWMLFIIVRIEACEVDTNSSVVECVDLSAFQLLNVTDAHTTLTLEQCTPSEYPIASSVIERIEIICNNTLTSFTFENFSSVHEIVLSQCQLNKLRWQSVFVYDRVPSVDLSECLLDCSCTNGWLVSSSQQHAAYSVAPLLPESFRCSFADCDWGILETMPYVECEPGGKVIIDVNVSAPCTEVYPNRKYFSWHMSDSKYTVSEYVTKEHLQLVIDEVKENQLGTITAVCWHCDFPLMTTIELRVRSQLRARLEDRGDAQLIIVSGWPISPINLTIRWNGDQETHNLSDHSAVTFFDNLVVRPDEGQSLFHRRVFSVFALACSHCPVDHPTGNYTFDICSTVNCFRLHNSIEHIGNHALLMRKRAMHDRVESRRTSRVTEETLLRLEERSSLSSSDYTNQIIPFIDLGTIQIHECIGKGAFGEVYCGSWEKTGERSVAIKSIKADEDVEKEVCTTVALGLFLNFIVTKGDLRSYLRQRAPTSTSYSQFPPALVEEELRHIVRQVC
ncbi:unnamed protein product [Nippostrongylus brasiliensis]|uniref:Tyrosine kinase (inferred by orthology to a S. mansoni protein) n=1 Tax=Nippostrongylus brasiliensis TaxID=27835 RepID=A0A0N4Y511_NIPBR|nr:unnamed protein product [Nippostrongylus brasiliensis]